MKKKNQISVLLFLILTATLAGCGVSGKSARGCGCPMVHKKAVG